MKLVIAEKPSVAKAIAAVLHADERKNGYMEGSGYLISWCIGHLISFADVAGYNEQYRKWNYDDLPIIPQEWKFVIAGGKEQQFSVLKDLMHRNDVTEIINACDSGREGELIFRFVYEQADCGKPLPAFGLAAWKKARSARAFQTSKTGMTMTISINPRFVGQRPIG